MVSRRMFLFSSAATLAARPAALTSKERVDRALAGRDVDRPPFTFWYHFKDEGEPGARHAESTLAFHRRFHTDLVKVMSDYPYPKASGDWYALRVDANPFPRQVEALRLIRDGLGGEAHFVETLFNPINVAEKLSSPDAVTRLKRESPEKLRAALDTIARSQANHVRHAIGAGASGVFLAIANSADPDYAEWSEPYDRMVMEAARSAPLNVLHVHGNRIDLSRFYRGWPVAALNYSVHGTKVPFAEARRHWTGILMGGIDEVSFRKLTAPEIAREAKDAGREASPKFLVAGGCSVPNETADAELTRAVGALRV